MLTIGASLHLPSVLLSLCSWSSLYFSLRRLEPWRKAEWHCRMVTAVHATLITLLTGWACFVQGPWPFTDSGGPNTPLQVTATTVCLGYFIFDLAWCLYFNTEGFPMLLHHSLSILGFVWTLCAGRNGTELVATICGSEVTNPLLQLRWFLKETGRYDTILGEVVDALFMLSFFTIRLGVGSVLIYCYFQQPTDFMGRVGATCIYLISWMFFVSIFQYAVYKYTKKYQAWKARNGQKTGIVSSREDMVKNTQNGVLLSENVSSQGKSRRNITANSLVKPGIGSSDCKPLYMAHNDKSDSENGTSEYNPLHNLVHNSLSDSENGLNDDKSQHNSILNGVSKPGTSFSIGNSCNSVEGRGSSIHTHGIDTELHYRSSQTRNVSDSNSDKNLTATTLLNGQGKI